MPESSDAMVPSISSFEFILFCEPAERVLRAPILGGAFPLTAAAAIRDDLMASAAA